MRREGEQKKSSEIKNAEVAGVICIAVSLVCACGLLGLNVGFIGVYMADFLTYFSGVGCWLVVLAMAFIGVQYVLYHAHVQRGAMFVLCFVFCLAIWHHFSIPPGEEILPQNLARGGGLIGGLILFIVRKFFGVTGSLIIISAAAVSSFLFATACSIKNGFFKTKDTAKKGIAITKNAIGKKYQALAKQPAGSEVKSVAGKTSFYDQEEDHRFDKNNKSENKREDCKKAEIVNRISEKEDFFQAVRENPDISGHAAEIEKEERNDIRPADNFNSVMVEEEKEDEFGKSIPDFPIEYSEKKEAAELKGNIVPQDVVNDFAKDDEAITAEDTDAASEENSEVSNGNSYNIPCVKNILHRHEKRKNNELEKEISQNAQILAKTLENFKVKAKIVNACHGPAVTRYELEPAPGVKVSKITNLADDLALALAAFSVRIEPIPGKAAIGVEVPNKELEGVQLCEVLENESFSQARSKLTVGLGIDIGGQEILADLAQMPHLLVAGATGSGKSVCINTIITSILFKARPDEVKFILIDPKMVELSNYNGIPHLMVPVVTDAKKAASVLNWAVQEMEKRYSLFASSRVRDMERFNNLENEEKMPAIVIIIDELADLMMVAPHDVEDAICRLAQKARAAGIHLVLATQRPSVDVITGIIKANIPSRISFAVSSQIDSRTILDMGGAEKLLGKGDMLFYPVGSSKPRRVQGAFVSDNEVSCLLDYIKAQGQEMRANEEIISFTENDLAAERDSKKKNQPEKDELLADAVKMVLSTGQASSSSIQRRFRIGYTRAARLIDTMEELQIVGPSSGTSKPREILMTTEQAMAVLEK